MNVFRLRRMKELSRSARPFSCSDGPKPPEYRLALISPNRFSPTPIPENLSSRRSPPRSHHGAFSSFGLLAAMLDSTIGAIRRGVGAKVGDVVEPGAFAAGTTSPLPSRSGSAFLAFIFACKASDSADTGRMAFCVITFPGPAITPMRACESAARSCAATSAGGCVTPLTVPCGDTVCILRNSPRSLPPPAVYFLSSSR